MRGIYRPSNDELAPQFEPAVQRWDDEFVYPDTGNWGLSANPAMWSQNDDPVPNSGSLVKMANDNNKCIGYHTQCHI